MWHTLRKAGFDGQARLGGGLLREHLTVSRAKHADVDKARRVREKAG
jgi:hypothetical protein